ncbi:MAG: hypothetical protein ACLPL5_00105 [Stellaceae bacterium]
MMLWPEFISRSITRATSAVSGMPSKAVVVTPLACFSTYCRPMSIEVL